MLVFLGLARVATAGCAAWSADDEDALAEAGVVVAGTVRDLDLVDGRVLQHVEIDRAWKGHVRSGWLTLVTSLGGGFFPRDVVFGVGSRVYVVGDPDAAGEVPVSPCTPTVGRFDGSSSRLVGLASKRPSTAARVEGSEPPQIRGPVAPFPKATADRARVARTGVLDLGGETRAGTGDRVAIEGQVIERRDGRTRGIWDTGDLRVVGWIDAADLDRAPIRTVSLAEGVQVAPGTELVADGGTLVYDRDGVRVSGALPADALGTAWRPAPVETVNGGWALLRDVAWSAIPGGPPIGTLSKDGGFALAAGAPVEGRVPVQIGAPGLFARGWLPEDALKGDGGGVRMGTAGGMIGGVPTITLPAGTDVVALDAAVVFARTTTDLVVPQLARDDTRVWVEIPTPWGPIGGEVAVLPGD